MRNKSISIFLLLLSSTFTRGDTIRYDQIPSQATSFFHLDVERLISSSLVSHFAGSTQQLLAQEEAALGGRLSSITLYSAGERPRIVVIVRGDPPLARKAEEVVVADRTAVVITYENQKVYYLQDNPWIKLADHTEARARTQVGSAPAVPAKPSGRMFTLGIPGLGPQDALFLTTGNGPMYVAFIGDNRVVATDDLPTMAAALDVAASRKPSLAVQDPSGLKATANAGVIFEGVGLAAQFKSDKIAATTLEKSQGFGLERVERMRKLKRATDFL